MKLGKGKGPQKRNDTLYTPYRRPDRTPVCSESRPGLLPPPETPPATPNMDLNDIRSTLCQLVSQIERDINRRACVHTSDVSGRPESQDRIPVH